MTSAARFLLGGSRRIGIPLSVILLLPLAACDDARQVVAPDDQVEAQIVRVEVRPSELVFETVGEQRSLSATAHDSSGDTVATDAGRFAWSSSDPAVARVDPAGLVTAVGEGSSVVSAAVGEIRGSASAVVPPEAPSESTWCGEDGSLAASAFRRSRAGPGPITAWRKLKPTTGNLGAVWGTRSDDVWAAGGPGPGVHFDGNAWSAEDGLRLGSGRPGIWGSAANDVWAVGGDVIRHFDGGGWHAIPNPGTGGLTDVWGFARRDVWAVGERGTLLRYDGDGWSEVENPVRWILTGVWGSAPDDVWVVGLSSSLESGTVLRYDGVHWSCDPVSSRVGFPQDVGGTGPEDVWIVGRGGAYHYDGERWSRAGIDGKLHAVWASGPEDVWVLGSAPSSDCECEVGRIAHFDGSGWEDARLPETAFTPANIPAAIWGTAPDDVWAVGRGGTILRYDGSGWRSLYSGHRVDEVWAAGPGDVWAVGSSILRSTGDGWEEFEVPGGGHLSDVWGSGPSDIWAVGNVIVRFDGSEWAEVPRPPEHLLGIWGSGSDDVWAAGREGTIMHYDGSTWREVRSPTDSHILDVWGSGPGDVWATTREGFLHFDGSEWARAQDVRAGNLFGSGPDDIWATRGGCDPRACHTDLLHYDGTGWTRDSRFSGTVYEVWASGPDDVWLVGADLSEGALPTAWVMHNDGTGWSRVDSPAQTPLYGVWGLDREYVWMLGASGQVIEGAR